MGNILEIRGEKTVKGHTIVGGWILDSHDVTSIYIHFIQLNWCLQRRLAARKEVTVSYDYKG